MGNEREYGSDIRLKKRKLNEERIRKERILKKRRRNKIKRMILSMFILLFLVVIGTGIYGYTFLAGLKTNNLGAGVAPLSSKDPINILVLGMDIGDTENLENATARRTDTMMVVNYNPVTEKIHIVSIPRDTLIEVEDAYLDSGESQRYWKINAAYALGGEEEVTKQVENLLDIDLNYLVEIDYEGFRGLIDAIGGVEMYIEEDMFYDDDAQDLHINFKAGETVLLDGKKSEEFFRWRKNNDGSGLVDGDLGRIRNQQKFIGKVIEKVISPSIIFKVPKILNVISENIETNMPANKILSLGLKCLKLDKSDIIMETLKGEEQYIYGQSFLVFNEGINKDLLNALKTSNPSDANKLTGIKREDFKIMILNGTKINGLAGETQDDLKKLGYKNVDTGNSQVIDRSVIKSNNKELKDLLKGDVNINKFEKLSNKEYEGYDAVIILGKDYDLFGN